MTVVQRRILVVEDDFLVGLATSDLLESMGCLIVGPAASLTAALQLARSELLDAAVLDVDLAGERVWPVADELQRRGVPFLFLSAYAHHNVVPPRFATVACLDKPVERSRLLNGLGVAWSQP